LQALCFGETNQVYHEAFYEFNRHLVFSIQEASAAEKAQRVGAQSWIMQQFKVHPGWGKKRMSNMADTAHAAKLKLPRNLKPHHHFGGGYRAFLNTSVQLCGSCVTCLTSGNLLPKLIELMVHK